MESRKDTKEVRTETILSVLGALAVIVIAKRFALARFIVPYVAQRLLHVFISRPTAV